MERERLGAIFNPGSIAIIGASRSRGKIGNEILRNLIYGGYEGAMYPINPKAEKVLGLKAYPSVASVPGAIDLAVVAIPADLVPGVVRECVEKGVKCLIITTSGFGEVGRGDLEEALKALVEGRGTRIIGPNTVGMVNTRIDLNASFFPAAPLKGGIAFITQSGALGGALVDWTRKEGLGMSKIVSLGNKCDVDDADLLDYFEGDGETEVIAMYIESLKEGRRFMEVAKRVSRRKPIIALKAGRSEAGGRAV
ncbi:MAG: CoA-binding protein, partial [Euryarchaeota archaeon]|nr:CoA-binding protein [Euryarchaeota archaeon]